MSLEQARRDYAAMVRRRAGIRSERLLRAFEEIPRERFLGPGPWIVASPQPHETPDGDAVHVYADISVALDAAHNLYNGAPGILGAWIDALDLHEGDRVFHVGGGTGYYTAIIAHVVGPRGRVVMVEVEKGLAGRAHDLLGDIGNVEVIAGDGTAHDPGPCEAVLVNAGASHPAPLWLDRLTAGGRVLLPLTFEFPNSNLGKGAILKITRQESGFGAAFLTSATPIVIYSCGGARSASLNQQLMKAYTTQSDRIGCVRSLRRDAHAPNAMCWVHGDGLCLSEEPVATAQQPEPAR